MLKVIAGFVTRAKEKTDVYKMKESSTSSFFKDKRAFNETLSVEEVFTHKFV